MKNLPLLVLALLVLTGIAKLGLEYRYAKQLDQLVQQMNPVASVKYREVDIEFDGSISVTGIEIRPYSLDSPIRIDKINLFSSDRIFLIEGSEAFSDFDLPEHFSVTIDAVKFDPYLIPEFDVTKECQSLEQLFVFRRDRRENYRLDFSVNFDFADLSHAAVTMDAASQYDSTSVRTVFNLLEMNPEVISSGNFTVQQGSVSTKLNGEAAQQFIDYCADQLQITQDQFITQVVGSTEFSSVLGFELGAEYRMALQKYIRGNSELYFDIKVPDSLASLEQLRFYSAKDIVNTLQLQIYLDGQLLVLEPIDLSNASNLDQQQSAKRPAKEQEQLKKNIVVDERALAKTRFEEARKNKPPPSYQQIKVKQLNSYLHYSVKVSRIDRPDISGRVLGYQKEELLIETMRYGGLVKFVIPGAQITNLKVFK